MADIGFHASHEQISPRQLLADVQRAEQAGFTSAMCSDHFSAWSERQGQSGFAWSWLGAALASTSLRFGVVNAPGQRYHPAIVAQAIATLDQMFPGRFWAALGTGENSNEHITGDAWPRKEHRSERLRESVDIIRALHAGETVSHEGHVTVHRARLFTLPTEPPPLVGAAVSEETARWCAEWADGLITVGIDPRGVARIKDAYREAGGRGPVTLQLHLSWAPTDDEALAIAHDQWRSNVFAPPVCWDLAEIAHFDEVSKHVEPRHMHDVVRISADLDRHAQWLREYVEAGFDAVMLHHVGQEQEAFIDAFGQHVLPQVGVSA
ncbi:TIGR03885 family FMN-dependent LLM class oxidoreductase [Demequina sp. NBRC 110053]|uniref:TIGR03885 family FMN-dependent LLM class oxidoreductase n=1 Tax=Demequina sp. NBRC 110053 TaxID=1570342 RepID=UPI0009FFD53F|nr:TIGR03885 family FMN-dependent LLM class oxidoreductase [Demequina sp. NBRC 110053]